MKRIWSRIKEQWNEFWDDDEFDECKYHLSSYDKRSLLYWGFVISGFTLGICLLISGLSNKYYDRKNNEDLQKGLLTVKDNLTGEEKKVDENEILDYIMSIL